MRGIMASRDNGILPSRIQAENSTSWEITVPSLVCVDEWVSCEGSFSGFEITTVSRGLNDFNTLLPVTLGLLHQA